MAPPLNEVASWLGIISESALDQWAQSLRGDISDEVLDYFKRRIRFFLARIDHGFIVDLEQAEGPFAIHEDEFEQMLLLGKESYQRMRDELSRSFKGQLKGMGLDSHEKQRIENQIDTLVRILEDSIAVSFMTALFNLASRLETEKQTISKTLCDMSQLLERERRRLAFDLHDGPAQLLSSALLQADILEDLIASAEAKRELASLKSILSQSLQELRTSIYSLKPQSVSQKGLVAKVKGYVNQFSSRTGIQVDLLVDSKERELPEFLEINIFRVIQEALSNVHKHAQASHVVINVAFNALKVLCSVQDDGVGFNSGGCEKQAKGLSGYGLDSMKDRVEQSLGSFEVESESGKGTRVKFDIPL